MKDKLKVNINFTAIKDNIINFIIPLVSLGTSVGLFLLVIYPAIKEMPQIKADLETASALKATLSTKTSNLRRLVDFKAAVDENSALVDRVLPPEDNVPELLNQIDNIARSSGLAVSRLNYTFSDGKVSQSGEELSSDYASVVVSLGAEGTYQQMVSFFENLEKASRIVDVLNFRLAVEGAASGTYSFNFTVYAPYLFVQSNAVTDEPVDLDITSSQFTDLINRLKGLQYYDNVVVLEQPAEPEAPVEESETPEEASTEEVVPNLTN